MIIVLKFTLPDSYMQFLNSYSVVYCKNWQLDTEPSWVLVELKSIKHIAKFQGASKVVNLYWHSILYKIQRSISGRWAYIDNAIFCIFP